jgi:hypothetical protein
MTLTYSAQKAVHFSAYTLKDVNQVHTLQQTLLLWMIVNPETY